MPSEFKKQPGGTGWLNLAALLSAIGASACCVGPLVFLSLGIGGAWMSNLTSLQVARPFFIVLTLVFLALAFRNIYIRPNDCGGNRICVSGGARRNRRILFWLLSLALIALLLFPELAPYFLK